MTNKTFEELQAKIHELEEDFFELKRKVENIYTPLIELTNEALFLVDKEYTYLFVTNPMTVNLSAPLHEIIGKKYGDFHKPDVTRAFEERPILLKFKEDENFNHRNTLSISRIALKLSAFASLRVTSCEI